MNGKHLMVTMLIALILFSGCNLFLPETPPVNTPQDKNEESSVFSMDMSQIISAKSIFLSSNSASSRNSGSSNSIYLVDEAGIIIKLDLIDQNGDMWEPIKLYRSGKQSICLRIKRETRVKDIIVNKSTGNIFDLTESLSPNNVIIKDEAMIIDDGTDCVYVLPAPNPDLSGVDGVVYKIDLTDKTIVQMNNPLYTKINNFVPIPEKLVTGAFIIESGKPLFSVNARAIFWNYNDQSHTILDQSTGTFWRLSRFGIDDEQAGTLRLFEDTINENNQIVEETLLNVDIDITYMCAFKYPNPRIGYNTAGYRYSWFDYTQKLLASNIATGNDTVIVMHYSAALSAPTVTIFPLSTNIATRIPDPAMPSVPYQLFAFLGDSFIVHREEDGLYITNYKTNTTRFLYNVSNLIEWNLNGDCVIVTSYIDNINSKTEKIDINGNVLSATATDIKPMVLIEF